MHETFKTETFLARKCSSPNNQIKVRIPSAQNIIIQLYVEVTDKVVNRGDNVINNPSTLSFTFYIISYHRPIVFFMSVHSFNSPSRASHESRVYSCTIK